MECKTSKCLILAMAVFFFAATHADDDQPPDDLGPGFKCEYQDIDGRTVRSCGYEAPQQTIVHWECVEDLYKSNFPFYTGWQKRCYPVEWTVVQQDEFY